MADQENTIKVINHHTLPGHAPELQHKLPEIFSLLRALMEKETGLQYLETVIRYLASVLDEGEPSLKQIKEMAEEAVL